MISKLLIFLIKCCDISVRSGEQQLKSFLQRLLFVCEIHSPELRSDLCAIKQELKW